MPSSKHGRTLATAMRSTPRSQSSTSEGSRPRMNFSCCGTCAPGEMVAEVGLGGPKVGYVYFHSQDAEAIVDENLFLGYGSLRDFSRGDGWDEEAYAAAAVAVGNHVVDVLRDHGLTVVWDGTLTKRIRVAEPRLATPNPARAIAKLPNADPTRCSALRPSCAKVS